MVNLVTGKIVLFLIVCAAEQASLNLIIANTVDRVSRFNVFLFTPDRRQSKTLLTIDERRLKSLEAAFLIAICRLTGDKWQSNAVSTDLFIYVCR